MVELADRIEALDTLAGAASELDLNALAARAAAGDQKALEQICLEIKEPIYRLALRFFSSPEDAEDCTQEILARARRTIRPILAHRCGLVDPEGSCHCSRIIGPSIECGIIPEGKPIYTRLERDPPGVDPEVFERAAEQLDLAERFAALFKTEPQFRAPARILAELRRSCPDLLG